MILIKVGEIKSFTIFGHWFVTTTQSPRHTFPTIEREREKEREREREDKRLQNFTTYYNGHLILNATIVKSLN